MKQEILDLIHLNTYIDYSANKATDADINELLIQCGMALDENYLNFLKELNGFRIHNLSIYGTKHQHEFSVSEAWNINGLRVDDYPALKEYFVIGEGFEELYGYSLSEKKYYVLEFNEEEVVRGKAFEDLDSFLDWAVKIHAKRFSEQDPIVQKKSLLHIIGSINTFLESHNFKKTRGNILINDVYSYERVIPKGIEWIGVDLQVHKDRHRMFGRVTASKRYDLIEDFFDPEDIRKTFGTVQNRTTVLLSTDYYSSHWDEFSEQKVNEDPEALASHFISFVNTQIFPAFSLYDNIRVLDEKVNESLTSMGNIAGGKYNGHYKMVIAKLAGNPIYDEIFRSIKERFEKGIRERPDGEKYRGYLEVTLKLNEKLQNVLPLKDGMLV